MLYLINDYLPHIKNDYIQKFATHKYKTIILSAYIRPLKKLNNFGDLEATNSDEVLQHFDKFYKDFAENM